MAATDTVPDRDLRAGVRGQPLRGLRIVELTSYVATPLCGMTLAQLGADVIRVEPLGGGPDRTRWPLTPNGTSMYWAGLNKGKRALEVDLGSPVGRGLVADLIVGGGRGGGIVVANSERHPELSFDSLRTRRPDVIHAVLTGRRDGGTAVDYTVQASTGFPLATGPEHIAEPVNHPLPAWDVAAGLYLATGLLAAERHRLLTGDGQQIRVALEDVALATAGNLGYLTEAQVGDSYRRSHGNYVYGSFGRDFRTADDVRLMLVVLTAKHWHDLLAITRLSGVVASLSSTWNADFDDEAERFRHREVLTGLVQEWFDRRTHSEAVAALKQTRVLWSTYRTFGDLAASDAQLLRSNPLLADLDQTGVGPHLAPGSPLVMAGEQTRPQTSPLVGEHTDTLLRVDLGLSDREIRRLHASGVVRAPQGSQSSAAPARREDIG